MIFITSYKRPKMLLSLLKELEGEDVVVFDDGSNYNYDEHNKYCGYSRIKHGGKNNFWKLWVYMFRIAKLSNADEFIFLQDDLYDIDLEGLRSEETPELYALNLMNVGPDRGWTPKKYVDCIFKTNRKTLESIDWTMPIVPEIRFKRDNNISSGVGQSLSRLFYEKDIQMILPKKNYASHGDNESFMHGELRKREPLIAKTGE